jgi:hypothetical protein
MSADWTPPGILRFFSIEWRARQYCDPVKKLAYLQRAAKKGTSGAGRGILLHWYSKAVLFVLVFLFVGVRVQTVTDVKAGLPRGEQATKTSRIGASPVLTRNSGSLEPAWLVEHGRNYDVYSNGLRIENEFARPNAPRSYVVFRNGVPGELHSKPAGIIFHTSESALAPFTVDENDKLTRIGRDLLIYVSRKQAYHFMIDRFGRVFRIVPETDVANHAGYSVWADTEGAYLNLNHSFLGISFEAHTKDLYEGFYLNASQIHSGHLLVEMLVNKYKIPLRNCITHAQVSVDPINMTIGYHTDGSGNFPFQEMGIPNNYELPIPSLYLFGFDFDSRFLTLTGTRIWKGLLSADERLRREADSQHLSIGQHKEILRERYQKSIATLKTLGIIKEN